MNNKKPDKFARIISTLFVPPFFTFALFTYFAFIFEATTINKIIVISTAFTFGTLFHILFFLYQRKRGKLRDNDASVKEERGVSYLFAILFYFFGWLILFLSKVNPISIAFGFSYIFSTLFIFLINIKWKISGHAMGAAIPLAAIVFVIGPVGLWFTFILIIVGWARIKLKVHNLSQVISGALLGFFSTYLQMYLIIHYFS